MKNLGTILKLKFPDAKREPDGDFRVCDLGDGPFLEIWKEDKLGPRPTDEQLKQWEAEFLKNEDARIV